MNARNRRSIRLPRGLTAGVNNLRHAPFGANPDTTVESGNQVDEPADWKVDCFTEFYCLPGLSVVRQQPFRRQQQDTAARSGNRDLVRKGRRRRRGLKLRDAVKFPVLAFQVIQTLGCHRPHMTLRRDDSREAPTGRSDRSHGVTVIDADSGRGASMNAPELATAVDSEGLCISFGQTILSTPKTPGGTDLSYHNKWRRVSVIRQYALSHLSSKPLGGPTSPHRHGWVFD